MSPLRTYLTKTMTEGTPEEQHVARVAMVLLVAQEHRAAAASEAVVTVRATLPDGTEIATWGRDAEGGLVK